MSTRWKLVHAPMLLALGLGGCAYGQLHQVLRAQVASELSCPEVRVKKKGLAYIGDEEDLNRYLVTGCGVTRTYTCPEDDGLISYDEPICSFEEGNSDAPEVAKMPDEPGAEADGMGFEGGGETDAPGEMEFDSGDGDAPAKPKPEKKTDKKPAAKKPAAKKPAAEDAADDDEGDEGGGDEGDED